MSEIKAFNPSAIADEIAEMEFRHLGKFNEGGTGIFWSEPGGQSPWEMHPDCDELLHVIEGQIEVEILPLAGDPSVTTCVTSGSFLIIPRGCWHRQTIIQRTKEFYLTPGQSLHSDDQDPRQATSGTD